MVHLLGNLACELEWRGAPPPPARVATRIAALATLMRALVEADEVTVWTPVPVDPARIPAHPALPRARLAVGTPPAGAAVLAWGASAALDGARPVAEASIARALDPAVRRALAEPAPPVAIARAVNDRRLAHELARALGHALPGGTLIGVIDEAVLAAAAAASPTGEWIAKLALTSAGRDRIRGAMPVDTPARTRLEGLLALGAVVVEPWLDRRGDLGVIGAIGDGGVTVSAPHVLLSDRHGGFRGIEPAPPPDAAHDRVVEVARVVGAALAEHGHRGIYGVDAFVHGDGVLRPLGEINARLTFGLVARALCARLGATRLRVGTDPPPGAVILVAPSADDPSAAWVERGAPAP